jgi:hypothetical protein
MAPASHPATRSLALRRHKEAQRHQEIVLIDEKADVNPIVSGRSNFEPFRNPYASAAYVD